ncbi:MAG: tRNA (guanine(26)-N(2))-dimethyltransferase [Nanoarchaeota archaeon]
MTIEEGKAKIDVTQAKIVSKQMPVFYNPVMKFNRDISVLLLSCMGKQDLIVGLPLAGSGIRGLRFLLELDKKIIKEVHFNDYDNNFKKNIRKNLKLNKISNKKIKLFNADANLFLLNSKGFGYIDIDPFGTPNPFLDSAVKRINRDGILAVTATDTSALSGTYPSACLRKYWAKPLRNELMHEVGLRILIRKVQLIGAQFEKALVPIFSFSKDHYMRVYLQCKKGKKDVDSVLKQHGEFMDSGPMWLGSLFDINLVRKMVKKNDLLENDKFLNIILQESKINNVGFYDIHAIAKRERFKNMPRKFELIAKINKLGFKASETHFSPEAIRSDIGYKELLKLF